MKLEQKTLELLISKILRYGVLASLILLSAGIIAYYFLEGTIELRLDSIWKVETPNFFTFILYSFPKQSASYMLLSLGIFALMLTPYLRVVASTVYFALIKDTKYLFITALVLVIITASLLRF